MVRILILITASILAVDAIWLSFGNYDVDVYSYLVLAGGAGLCAAGSYFYGFVRKDEKLSSMLFGTGFLIVFSAAFSLLTYLLLTVAGPRIDVQLAVVDRYLGFNWPAAMRLAADHPTGNLALFLAYNSMLPQAAILLNCLGLSGRSREVYKLCLAVAIGACITVTIWTLAPSFGAFAVYEMPTGSDFLVMADRDYAETLLRLAENGPGLLSPSEIKGLIAFPSFHAAMAVFMIWYARELVYLRWPALALNLLVLASIPIQGGHHAIDIFAGVAVAAAAIWVTGFIARKTKPVRWLLPTVTPEPTLTASERPG